MNKIDPRTIHAGIPDLREAIVRHVRSSMARRWQQVTIRDQFFAVSLAIRDRMIDIAVESFRRVEESGAKRAYYLSMEYLLGRSLEANLVNLGLLDECREVIADLGSDLDEILHAEPDAGLGNGGLGRLAACFVESLATLGMPGYGYGINYEYGLFRQAIQAGRQVERPDHWLRDGTPWEIERPEDAYEVGLFGHVEDRRYGDGAYRPTWTARQRILGVPNDMPVAGYGGRTVTGLRLFAARSSSEFDMQIFNEGDYVRAVEQKALSETISKVLYPSEQPERGPMLRLIQEHFLVACALQDILHRHERDGEGLERLPDRVAIQMNDTHPALAVAELMRLLVDRNQMPWEHAWDITTRTLAYTNHTLLPEALETWPVSLVGEVLPRHLQIIYEINRRFLMEVEGLWPGDEERKLRMSLIQEGDEPRLRMANLAIVGSHSVNGVAAVHTELVKKELVPDFHQMWPHKFNNKTNGVTPRRWILQANPGLSGLLTEAVGEAWITDLEKLRDLEPLAGDPGFQEKFRAVKRENKVRLDALLRERCGVSAGPDFLFDSQIKRIHEYKRQILNLLHAVHHYLEIVEEGRTPPSPQVYLFAGKAAPGYQRAKEIIHLIHCLGGLVNHDPRASEWMKIAFVPNYGVTSAEIIIPATDLSEQISTAGFEASGTGNMKFAMNGALTIGTQDGANIEIAEEVGAENILIFGNTVEDVRRLRNEGVHPRVFYDRSEDVRRVMDAFTTDRLCPGEAGRFRWVFDSLVDHWDPYFHLADLDTYLEAHRRGEDLYADAGAWARAAILNVARMGKFSSDRTIREYARDIWNISPVA